MSITPVQVGTSYTPVTLTKQSSAAEKSGQIPTTMPSVIVDIKSGRELMISRLWEVNDQNYDPVQVSRFERDSYRGKVYSFLNQEDRKLVSELYEYARDKEIGFEKVDSFAFGLAHYRQYPDSQPGYLGGASDKSFTAEFWPEDEKIILNLLTSNAIKDTTIDHGFLAYMFELPNKTARTNFSFEFLQEVVFSHSASGSDGSADPDAVVPLRPWQKLEMFRQGYRDQGWDIDKMTLQEFQGRQEGWWPTEEGQFGRYANRIDDFMRGFLKDDDKTMLGLAYAIAEKKAEKLEKIDKLAIELALMRMQQQMQGELQADAPKDDKKAFRLYPQLEELIKNIRAGKDEGSQKI